MSQFVFNYHYHQQFDQFYQSLSVVQPSVSWHRSSHEKSPYLVTDVTKTRAFGPSNSSRSLQGRLSISCKYASIKPSSTYRNNKKQELSKAMDSSSYQYNDDKEIALTFLCLWQIIFMAD